MIESLGAWPARAAWVALALAGATTVGDALDGRSTAVRLVVGVGLWAGWAGGLVALLVARDTALTALRIIVPAGLGAVVAAASSGGPADAADALAVGVGALAVLAVLMPWIGEAWVDGSSYGPERRFPLRPPVALGYVLAPIVWLLVMAGVTCGPLLLATGQWISGAVGLAVGTAVVWIGVRALHQLARRWVVLVPAGLVLHDPLTMPEPQLVLRRMVAALGPAPADTEADDLTAGAAGLALQLDLVEPIDLLVRARGGSVARSATSLLFTPSRPRKLLDAARTARLPIG